MSKKFKKSSSKTLHELRTLVSTLSDRDVQLKRDFKLFEDFLENFPIPVSMWSANIDGKVLNKRGKGFFCKSGDHISDLFSCETLACNILDNHKEAEKSGTNSSLIKKDEKIFYVTIAPRHDDNNIVIGVSGIAWDVSSNNFILNTLIEIKNDTETKSGAFKDIAQKAENAIKKSRLFALINKEKPNVK